MAELVFKFKRGQTRIKLTKNLARALHMLAMHTEHVYLEEFWDKHIGHSDKSIREVQYEPGLGLYMVDSSQENMVSVPLSQDKVDKIKAIASW